MCFVRDTNYSYTKLYLPIIFSQIEKLPGRGLLLFLGFFATFSVTSSSFSTEPYKIKVKSNEVSK